MDLKRAILNLPIDAKAKYMVLRNPLFHCSNMHGELEIWPPSGWIVAPPYEDFVIGYDYYGNGDIWVLNLIKVIEVDKEDNSFVYRDRGGYATSEYPIADDTKWLYIHTMFLRHKGEWIQLGTLGFCQADENGRITSGYGYSWTNDEKHNKTAETLEAVMANVLWRSMFAVSLMNCVNVEKVEHLSRRSQRRGEFNPRFDYYTLSIKRTRKQYETGDDADNCGRNRQHIVRGHFKTYTEDAPLFGQYVGTYYWENQVRGNPDKGTIDKDYSVDV